MYKQNKLALRSVLNTTLLGSFSSLDQECTYHLPPSYRTKEFMNCICLNNKTIAYTSIALQAFNEKNVLSSGSYISCKPNFFEVILNNFYQKNNGKNTKGMNDNMVFNYIAQNFRNAPSLRIRFKRIFGNLNSNSSGRPLYII